MRAQTHIASDYEGDAVDRFMNHEYKIGERMRWFDRDHPDYASWKTWGGEGSTVVEECHAVCGSCGTALQVAIEFTDVSPARVLAIARPR